jgi:hypothetical protein
LEKRDVSKTMTNRNLALRLVVPFALMPTIGAFCQCTPTSTDKTAWGGNINVVLKEPEAMRNVRGIVKDPLDKPMTGVLVEVYDHPEVAVKNPSPDRTGQGRIAACRTGETGMFSLDLEPGKYELRFSKSSGWNVTTVPVEVKKSAPPTKQDMVVKLYAGY